MPGKLDVTLLRKAVRSAAPNLVRRLFDKLQPEDLAPLLGELPPSELKVVIEELLRGGKLAATLQAIPEELLPEVAQSLDPEQLARALSRMELDDAARLVYRLEEDFRRRVLERADSKLVRQIERLLRYSPDSAGGRMIPRFVAVAETATVGEGILSIRKAGPEVPLYYLYVVDEQGMVVGVVSLPQLVKAPDEQRVIELMRREVLWVAPEADQEEVARLVVRTNILAVPVVEGGVLVGLVTVDDVIDVLEQEATEDMYNMAGLSGGDRVFSTPYRSLVKRLPWNTLNLATSSMAAVVVALFQPTIEKIVALAVVMPVVASLGGNTGNQTLTVIIRGIALGELQFSSALRAVLKEVAVALGIGVVLGTLAAIAAALWQGNAMLGVVVALAIVANLLVAALVGTAIPLTLKRLGMDPALGGSILVTMFTDVFGFLSFLGLATLLMRYLL